MKKNKTFYAIIPARGGSKGVPKKNILPINNRPLISYTINISLSSKLINKTFVSTDNKKIAEISKIYGADVPFKRPKKISGDHATDLEVFFHMAKYLQKNNDLPDYFIHLRPTNPIRQTKTINRAINLMIKNPKFESLRSVNLAEQSPFKMWKIKDDKLEQIIKYNGHKESHSLPRQLLPLVYWQNGYIDIIKPSTILNKKSMTGSKIYPFVIEEKIFEIDYPEDVIKVVKAINNKKINKKNSINRYPV
jgi:N-acylneuraminate cytidylyltransferase